MAFGTCCFQKWLNTGEHEVQPELWLKGSPGTRKSFICSVAINHATRTLRKIGLYYFHRFDDQDSARLGSNELGDHSMQAAAVLVDQIFRYFWRQDRRIAGPVAEYIETAEKNTKTLTEVICLILKYGHQFSPEQDTASEAESANLYIFLDGLNESSDPHAVDEILRLFHGIEKETPATWRLWISSRDSNA